MKHVVLCTLLLLASSPSARARFVVQDGTNPDHLRRGVAVGLVRITRVHTDPVRKRAGYALYRHVDLKPVRMVYGRRPPARALRHIPFATQMNSAWTEPKGGPLGQWYVMAWVRDQPCGLGLAVSLSDRVMLPFHVKGPRAPWIEAIRQLLHAVDQPNLGAQLQALNRAFRQQRRPRLAYLADAALSRIQTDHRNSARRFLRLLALVDTRPGADPLLGWTLIHELSRFPALGDAAAYRRAWGGTVPRRWPLTRFRRHVIGRVSAIAAGPKTPAETRRNALLLLARPPCLIAPAHTPEDARAIQAMRRQLRARIITVRRTAVSALLHAAARLRTQDGPRARRLVAEVRAALLREKSTAERAILKQRVREIWGRRAAASAGESLSADVIRGVIRRHLKEIQYCYVSVGIRSNPRLRGTVKVTFTVLPSGHVGKAEVSSSTLHHVATQRCILSAIRRWRFPRSRGKLVYVTYPFHFKPHD